MSVIVYFSWAVDPVIFKVGGLSVHWYSLLFALGFLASYQILKVYFSKENVPQALLDKLTIYMVVATVVGARLGHCLFYDPEYYSQHILEIFLPIKLEPNLEFTGFQGLASHGGAIAILLAIVLFSGQNKISIFWILDKLSLVIPLAGCLIRLGNFMNSEMVGKPSSVPWAIIFERIDLQPRHPGQLYEAILYFIIFLLLNALNYQDRRQPGFIFGLFLILLFSARFVVELWKEDQTGFEQGLLFNMGQLLSIPFIILGFVLVFLKSSNLKRGTTLLN